MGRFTGDEGRFLSSDEANGLTGAYLERKKKQEIPEADTIRSEFFGINNLKMILNQPGCVGLRVYHAKRQEDINGNTHLIPRVLLVGIDGNGDEMLTLTLPLEEGMKDMPTSRDGTLGDGPVCPPACK
ncbi:hypothetical protein [Larkinella soli]|uniref:hypothetical protein n=1 Tax=Larkinella soli TaxID=1770527 RepID=UPI000FFB198B|nr:hypothetical protein [Larkinella soli]